MNTPWTHAAAMAVVKKTFARLNERFLGSSTMPTPEQLASYEAKTIAAFHEQDLVALVSVSRELLEVSR